MRSIECRMPLQALSILPETPRSSSGHFRALFGQCWASPETVRKCATVPETVPLRAASRSIESA
eukprot:13896790-Alexandrium_andersonii.AAC.1